MSHKTRQCELRTLLTVIAVVIFFYTSTVAQNTPADLIVTNGRIYTVNSRQPWAEAIAVRRDKIVAVGSASEVAAQRGNRPGWSMPSNT